MIRIAIVTIFNSCTTHAEAQSEYNSSVLYWFEIALVFCWFVAS
jgi:hypothetical protein